MYLKQLKIASPTHTIREINFHKGINLIVDETPSSDGKETGNNVGKTTVLMLIDFCLGSSPKNIYTDPENKKEEHKLVKGFLIENEILITLTLKSDLDEESSEEIKIERNFLARKRKIQKVNGLSKTDDEFDEALTEILFKGHYGQKPTFRQIISHNIRYRDLSLTNTLYNLDKFTRDEEYETLYLFLLDCNFTEGNTKQDLLNKIRIEQAFKAKLEKSQTKSAYEVALSLIDTEISKLNHKKRTLNLNENFEKDLNFLNNIKYEINTVSSEIGRLNIRHSLIKEAERDILETKSEIDIEKLGVLYNQAASLIPNIQKTFAELCNFHNQMVSERAQYISKDIPKLENDLRSKSELLRRLLEKEEEVAKSISQSVSFEDLESIISELNEKYQKKGEYESIIQQLESVDEELAEFRKELSGIDDLLFSQEFEKIIKDKVDKFNIFFSAVSEELYGEKYALKVDQINNKGKHLYKFSAFNTNFSSGKKQGEISCFDIAYTLFADENDIPCFHFLLNDKKELMHDNQLLKIAELVNKNGIQFVASILRDKLPEELNKDELFIVKLSQSDKLFRIEQLEE
ncbi:DUF2326 domain-containing protein [Pseudomonas sp. IT-196MI5]|uniref:DUF2326 domain-containing protein n=1 Tax=Pseudomonas sp. IT-196MI5 TaxID=3026440 RepID=UPI0039E17868